MHLKHATILSGPIHVQPGHRLEKNVKTIVANRLQDILNASIVVYSEQHDMHPILNWHVWLLVGILFIHVIKCGLYCDNLLQGVLNLSWVASVTVYTLIHLPLQCHLYR